MASRGGQEAEPQGRSLGKKLKGIFSKTRESPQRTGQPPAGFLPPPGPQRGVPYHPVPGPYFASQPPSQQWAGHSSVPSRAPNQLSSPGSSNPYRRPLLSRPDYPSPQFGSVQVGRQSPLPPTRYEGAPIQRVQIPSRQIPNGPNRRSPQPPQYFGGPSPQRVYTPNVQIRPPQHGPPQQGTSFTMPIHQGGNQGGGFLRPGPPVAMIPSLGAIRAHSPAGSFVSAGGPDAQPQPVIVVFPGSSEDDDNDMRIHRVRGPSGPSTRDPPERIPVRTENGIVFLKRVADYSDSERSSSPELPPQAEFRPGAFGRQVVEHEYDDYSPSKPATSNGSRPPVAVSSQADFGEGGVGEINFNRRYDYMPANMAPEWYIRDPEVPSLDAPSYLCANCRHIDFITLFRQEETNVMPKVRDYIMLGQLHAILANSKHCGFCRFVLRMVGYDGTADARLTSEEDRLTARREKILGLLEEAFYLCPIRFKTTYNNPALYICSAQEVAEAAAIAAQNQSSKTAVIRPRNSMAFRPLHISAPNLGRLLREPATMDFEWVRERMALCDERDCGKQNFQHRVPVRAIDVQDMCIVDVEDGARYVTLSYTWGDVEQPRLTRAVEPQLRRPAGLWALMESVPLTVRDAMTLTRKIGERLLWVDALCIVQDDLNDLHRSLGEMGNIYRHSILTICACCGKDAAYGLPGVRPGTRRTEQLRSVVGGLALGNILPASEAIETSKWSTRGWTMQEKVLSQRKLQLTDHCAVWWCWHTITSEDENCRHSGWQPGARHRGMHFFRDEHELVVSKRLGRSSNMDTYAFMISDYTSRNLKFQTDAANALLGVFDQLDGTFRGEFVAGLPDTEMTAGLLWVPIGPHQRRCESDPDSGKPRPLFPSWSWLGWVGQVAYPWLIERSLPMSESGSPLLWRNYAEDGNDEDAWFTGNCYRLNGVADPNAVERQRGLPPRWRVDPIDGWSSIDSQNDGSRWLHPVQNIFHRRYAFVPPGGCSMPKLHFRTLSAFFRLEGAIRRRKKNFDHLHKVYQVRVLSKRGFCAGYIYVPDLENMSPEEAQRFDFIDGRSREFVVLSRASTTPDPRAGKELLHTTPIDELSSVYSMGCGSGWVQSAQAPGTATLDGSGNEAHIDEAAHFDTRVFDSTTPWALFNVMMIEREEGDAAASRITIGRIHVAAFMDAGPCEREVVLE